MLYFMRTWHQHKHLKDDVQGWAERKNISEDEINVFANFNLPECDPEMVYDVLLNGIEKGILEKLSNNKYAILQIEEYGWLNSHNNSPLYSNDD